MSADRPEGRGTSWHRCFPSSAHHGSSLAHQGEEENTSTLFISFSPSTHFFPQELRWGNIWALTLNCSSYFWSDHPCRMLRVLLHILHSKAVWYDTNALNMAFGGGFGNKRLRETNKQVKQPWSDFWSGHMDELKSGSCLSNLVVLRPFCWVSIANES